MSKRILYITTPSVGERAMATARDMKIQLRYATCSRLPHEPHTLVYICTYMLSKKKGPHWKPHAAPSWDACALADSTEATVASHSDISLPSR